ncbi:MAG: DUF981 family protein [Chloroflexota bacterium]
MLLAQTGGLVIDWTQMPTYNTIMAVAAGAGLLGVVMFARDLRVRPDVHLRGWALAFAVPGFILALTGAHMTLTWPFAKYFPFDNIIFGEPSLAFGVLLLAAALYLWTRGEHLGGIDAHVATDDPAGSAGEPERDEPARVAATLELARVARPMTVFLVGLGLSLLAIAAAGIVFQLFAAPPEEPISGAFAEWPWLEATFMSGLFALVGIGCLSAPFALGNVGKPGMSTAQRITGVTWALAGIAFLLFGALNFFTHIGLIVHTMAPPG